LLQEGCHRGARDAAGRTAAQVADLAGKTRCATLVREADDRVSALHAALRSGSDSAVEALLKRNSGILNMSDASGKSCIHAAAAGDAFEAMRILLSR
jgi:ankyrin repeat protein